MTHAMLLVVLASLLSIAQCDLLRIRGNESKSGVYKCYRYALRLNFGSGFTWTLENNVKYRRFHFKDEDANEKDKDGNDNEESSNTDNKPKTSLVVNAFLQAEEIDALKQTAKKRMQEARRLVDAMEGLLGQRVLLVNIDGEGEFTGGSRLFGVRIGGSFCLPLEDIEPEKDPEEAIEAENFENDVLAEQPSIETHEFVSHQGNSQEEAPSQEAHEAASQEATSHEAPSQTTHEASPTTSVETVPLTSVAVASRTPEEPLKRPITTRPFRRSRHDAIPVFSTDGRPPTGIAMKPSHSHHPRAPSPPRRNRNRHVDFTRDETDFSRTFDDTSAGTTNQSTWAASDTEFTTMNTTIGDDDQESMRSQQTCQEEEDQTYEDATEGDFISISESVPLLSSTIGSQ